METMGMSTLVAQQVFKFFGVRYTTQETASGRIYKGAFGEHLLQFSVDVNNEKALGIQLRTYIERRDRGGVILRSCDGVAFKNFYKRRRYLLQAFLSFGIKSSH